MKKTVPLILVVCFVIAACTSSKKYLSKGQYDNAINKAVKKLQRKPTDREEILVLEEAYQKAVQRDKSQIDYLKKEGNPDAWDEIFRTYKKMKDRQALVKTVLPLQLPERAVRLDMENYNDEIIRAKKKAAEYFYNHAQQLMRNRDKQSFRQAYNELTKVKEYDPSYPQLDQLMKSAKEKGMTDVYVTIENNTKYKLSYDFRKTILNFGSDRLNDHWRNYFIQPYEAESYYDYTILVNLKIIDISPEAVKESRRVETRKVKDGWEYELDEDGNVKKDSLGNDIKKPKIKEISCEVIETLQKKSAHIEGVVEYHNNATGQVIKSEPVAADSHFEYISAVANGNREALSAKTREQLGNTPISFPSDEEMIHRTAEALRNAIYEVLKNHKRYIN